MQTINRSEDLIPKRQIIFIGLLLILGLYQLSLYNYPLFHTMVEGFAIIVASLIYVIGSRTFKYSANKLLLFLGFAYLFIGILDFFHLASYYGMNIFPDDTPNTSTQLWIAGRYMEAASLFMVPLIAYRNYSRVAVFWSYAFSTSLLLIFIIWMKVFPVCYIHNQGLTTFKIISEYIIITLVLGAIIQLYWRRKHINRSVYLFLTSAMAVTILSELSFTLYTDVYGFINFLGHMFKVISYTLIYWGIIIHGLENPYEIIFKELNERAYTDILTGLYNRQGFMEFAKKELAGAHQKGYAVGFLMMDLDKFKRINDHYGHQVGDEVLKHFAEIIRNTVPKTGITGRLGGDEFVVLLKAKQDELDHLQKRIREAVRQWASSDEITRGLSVSIGSSLWKTGQPVDIDELIKKADESLYAEKEVKKSAGVIL